MGYPPAGGGYPGGYGGPQGPPPGADPTLWNWFITVDRDRSGQITADELQQALLNGNWSQFNAETCRLMIGKNCFKFFLFPLSSYQYRIYLNKRRSAYKIFCTTSVALIQGRRLFKLCSRQIYFFYIFIQRYTFYLLIFPWTDTKLIVNLELREKFSR